MVDALQKAKAQLVTKVSVSKKELKDYIASNELDKLDTNKYLTSTADSFKEALKNAQTLIEKEDATKEQLDEALKQLKVMNHQAGIICSYFNYDNRYKTKTFSC